MKFFTLLLLIFITTAAFAQVHPYEKEVIEADTQLNELIKTSQASKAESLYAEDFVLTTSSGKSKVKNEMLNQISSPDLKLEINTTENIKVRVLNATAVLTGKLHQKGSYKGQSFDHFLLVSDTWVKTDTGWKLLSGHATLLPKS